MREYRSEVTLIERLSERFCGCEPIHPRRRRQEGHATARDRLLVAPRTPGPIWADPLTPSLVDLVTQADTAESETLRTKIKDIGNLLTQLAHPKSDTGT